jgi:urease accessory protein
MRYRSFVRSGLAGLIMVATALPAWAHVGHSETDGFIHGFMHPVGGLDHVLAMVSVGLLAALLGGRAVWMLPISFIIMMAAGAVAGMAGFDLPYVELGISLSVIVLGCAVALQLPLPMIAASILVGGFAIFHGFAHGAEMPVDASGASYGAGFLLATALLHLAGLLAGLALPRWAGAVSRAAGGMIALAGIVLATAG